MKNVKFKSSKESVLLLAQNSAISDYYLINLTTGQQGRIGPEIVKQIWEKKSGKVYEFPLFGIGEEVSLCFSDRGEEQIMTFLLLPLQKKNRSYSSGVGAPYSYGSFRPNNTRLALDVLH